MVILYTNQVYTMKIPDNYLPVMPYLVLDKAVEFKQFCEHTFNATEQMIVPGEDNKQDNNARRTQNKRCRNYVCKQ